ncbi:MAG: hypothetical protein K0S61_4740 [Anaerocolumna sp.]|jgi:hypothetical protein|nr:hypothetical protein [Anaerocolumna sp.]
MDYYVKGIYLSEIQIQCKLAFNAISQLNFALKQLFSNELSITDWEQRQFFHYEVFRAIHSFLTHASNISKLLWPSLPRRKETESDEAYENRCYNIKKIKRASILRETINISEDEHPLKSRKLRDHLEHFDERLDGWEESSPNRNYVQDNIGPRGSISGIKDTDIMRWFDQTTNEFLFRGEIYYLQPIATALNEVFLNVQQAIKVNEQNIISHYNART